MRNATQLYTALERAFMLAADGSCSGAAEVRMQLAREGFSTQQLTGPVLLRQIRDLCISAQEKR